MDPFASRTILILISAFGFAVTPAWAEPCPSGFSNFGGTANDAAKSSPPKLVSMRSVSVDELNQRLTEDVSRVTAEVIEPKLLSERFNLLGSEIYDKNSIYIGVANTEKEGAHHYYLVAGDKRYDGIPYWSTSQTKDITGSVASAPKGVIFKIGVSDEVIAKVVAAIENRATSRNFTCFNGLCKVLDEAEIVVGDGPGKFGYRLVPFVKGVASGDIKTSSGQPTVQMYATSKDELNHFLKEVKTAERTMLINGAMSVGGYGGMVVIYSGLFGGFGYVVYQVVVDHK